MANNSTTVHPISNERRYERMLSSGAGGRIWFPSQNPPIEHATDALCSVYHDTVWNIREPHVTVIYSMYCRVEHSVGCPIVIGRGVEGKRPYPRIAEPGDAPAAPASFSFLASIISHSNHVDLRRDGQSGQY